MTTPKITAADIREKASAAIYEVMAGRRIVEDDCFAFFAAALSTLPITLDQLAAIANGESKVMPAMGTPEMYDGFRSVNCTNGSGGMAEFTTFRGDFGNWRGCYQAMFDAAPAPAREGEE